jgi:hypothetical protein
MSLRSMPDATGKTAQAIRWERQPVAGTMLTHPGVYCLRTHELTWDAERLWRTYTLLTDLEAVFRSLKSELGLRPIYHRTEARVDGHLFISVLAYQCRATDPSPLARAWHQRALVDPARRLAGQCRVTATFRRADGRTLHVRRRPAPSRRSWRSSRRWAAIPAREGYRKCWSEASGFTEISRM